MTSVEPPPSRELPTRIRERHFDLLTGVKHLCTFLKGFDSVIERTSVAWNLTQATQITLPATLDRIRKKTASTASATNSKLGGILEGSCLIVQLNVVIATIGIVSIIPWYKDSRSRADTRFELLCHSH